MKKVGITGGIGSGKTIVCEVFKLLGISVFHADIVARNLQQNNFEIRKKLIDLFGESIYSQDGTLDRKRLAGTIFKDKDLLGKVNQIIHPAVREIFFNWMNEHSEEDYVLYEAAILFESGYHNDFDLNILVVAEENIRMKRVMQRDNISRDSFMERVNNQMNDQEKIPQADYILENNEKKLLIPQIIELDKVIRNHGKVW